MYVRSVVLIPDLSHDVCATMFYGYPCFAGLCLIFVCDLVL